MSTSTVVPTEATPPPAAERTIAIEHLSKTFGAVRAVDDLSFTVRPGRVTGFLGPNGAGKTTTLRMLLGLVRPTSGTATIGGRTYAQLTRPMHTVGAALEASSFHPGRTALDHLRVYAPQAGVPDARCREVLAIVGLDGVAKRRVGGFSLGMRQRLGLATTLLGDPGVLLLDEPANGLDPEGIAWLRAFLRHLAGEGRTVLVSSHVLSEVEQTVDDVIIIARGRLVHASPLAELAALAEPTVRVTSPDAAGLRALVTGAGWDHLAEPDGDPAAAGGPGRPRHGGSVVLRRVPAGEIGARAFAAGLELHELAPRDVGLEGIFLRLVDGGAGAAAQAASRPPGTIAPGADATSDASLGEPAPAAPAGGPAPDVPAGGPAPDVPAGAPAAESPPRQHHAGRHVRGTEAR